MLMICCRFYLCFCKMLVLVEVSSQLLFSFVQQAVDKWMGRQEGGLRFHVRVGKVAGTVATGAAVLRFTYLEWKRSKANNDFEPENAKVADVKSRMTVGEKEQ